MSKAAPDKSHKYHQGRYSPKNIAKYKGDPTRIFYRSGWELRVFMRMDTDKNVLEWSSEEVRIPYEDKTTGRLRTYYPDCWCRIKTKAGNIDTLILEIKPKKETLPPKKEGKRFLKESMTYARNICKWEASLRFCAQKGWQFKVLTEDDLF